MQTALSQFANCTLYVDRIEGYDDTDINQMPIVKTTEVRALLKRTSKTGDLQWLKTSGSNFEETEYDGYSFTGIPNFEGDVRCRFDYGIEGKIRLKVLPTSPYYDQLRVIGQPIRGLFHQESRDSNYVDTLDSILVSSSLTANFEGLIKGSVSAADLEEVIATVSTLTPLAINKVKSQVIVTVGSNLVSPKPETYSSVGVVEVEKYRSTMLYPVPRLLVY